MQAIAELPTGVLQALIFRYRGTANELVAIVREMRRRVHDGSNVWRWSDRTIARMNMIDPPACACGRAGIYIVGTTTYCRKCRAIARAHLMETRGEYFRQRESIMEKVVDDSEKRRKNIDGLRSLRRGRGQKK